MRAVCAAGGEFPRGLGRFRYAGAGRIGRRGASHFSHSK